MSSSPNSSSSSEAGLRAGESPAEAFADGRGPARLLDLRWLGDVRCPVTIVLGTASISVRRCLSLAPKTVIRLQQTAGEDVRVMVGEVPVARAEVVVGADSTAVRLTQVLDPSSAVDR